ncbi:chromosomal replication initiator protein DnaA [bacterium]|nr:MAG: chromosomal replication initiator protein DnaA [bacterium]
MQDVKGLWQSVLGDLETTISEAMFKTWFKQTDILTKEDGHVVVAVPNAFAQKWLRDKFHGEIKTALARADRTIQTVDYKIIQVPKEPVKPGRVAPATFKKTTVEQIAIPTTPAPKTNLNPRYTFATFVVGGSNDFAHAAAQAVAKNPGTKYNPLFIYGGVGLGKTHLMQAVGNEIVHKDPSKRIEYVSIESFTNEFINAIQKKKNDAFADKYRGVDVLIIDDMQFLAGKEKTQDEFFHTFNALHQANKQIIISSDKPPKLLTMLEDRLISRFEMGITVDIQPPDLETRSAIIQNKAASQGMVLPLEVVDFIARHAQHNIRELEGTLTKVLAELEHNKGTMSLERVRSLLAHDAAARPRLRVTNAKTIMERVARYFDLTVADLEGPKRDKEIVVPRQIAMYLMRTDLDLSFPKIAAAVGGRDHTTAMHSVQKLEKLVDNDDTLRSDITAIREQLGLVN